MSAATSLPPTPTWHQVTVEFTDYALAEQAVVAHLWPIMERSIDSWWFIRKAPCWRLRYLPPRHDAEANVRNTVHQALDAFRAAGDIAGWVETIYEPEVHAFGGPDAMTVAHQLFHHDSQHILGHLSSGRDQRRELTILLCGVFMRGRTGLVRAGRHLGSRRREPPSHVRDAARALPCARNRPGAADDRRRWAQQPAGRAGWSARGRRYLDRRVPHGRSCARRARPPRGTSARSARRARAPCDLSLEPARAVLQHSECPRSRGAGGGSRRLTRGREPIPALSRAFDRLWRW
jgi:thiopeptide-type bacteriocin biosynthesis protein